MSNSDNGPPNLQSILATLAQFTHPTPPTGLIENNRNKTIQDVLDQEYYNPQGLSSQATQGSVKSTEYSATSKSPIDPASITVWPEALRCVTHIAAQNAQFGEAIRKMIESQRANEIQWFKDRQAHKHRLASRNASAARAQSILQSLHPSAALNMSSAETVASASPLAGLAPQISSAEKNAEEALTAELNAFDAKIHRAQAQMEVSMIAQLKALGVPFFGTTPDLITTGDKPASSPDQPSQNMAKHGSNNRPKYSVLVTREELRTLQRRMLEYLEDLHHA